MKPHLILAVSVVHILVRAHDVPKMPGDMLNRLNEGYLG